VVHYGFEAARMCLISSPLGPCFWYALTNFVMLLSPTVFLARFTGARTALLWVLLGVSVFDSTVVTQPEGYWIAWGYWVWLGSFWGMTAALFLWSRGDR
jgi:hypothetical protein